MALNNSLVFKPNLLLSPPLSSHLPLPLLESLMRKPMLGRMCSRAATRSMSSSSLSFSTTTKMRRPIFCASRASSMYPSSL